MLLLLPLALATPPAPANEPTLLIPVVPPAGSAPHTYSTFASLPKGASRTASWTSDDAAVTCTPQDDLVAVALEVPGPAWPYSLPATATCAQGDVKLVVHLGFGAPEVMIWRAADGTVVVPHRDGGYRSASVETPEPVTRAAVVPETAGVTCAVNDRGVLSVTAKGAARPGTAHCQATLASGAVVDEKVVVVPY